jgi:hypothetical protein
MRIYKNEYEANISNPLFNYQSDIHLAITKSRHPVTGDIFMNDNGIEYDYRTCTAEWLLGITEIYPLVDIFETSDCRGILINMELPGEAPLGCGFHPFGPDMSDFGTYTFTETENSRSSRLHRPKDYYELKTTLLMNSFPYKIGYTGVSEGDMQIGSVTGLPYADVKLTKVRCNKINISRGGVALSTDIGNDGMYTDSNITFETCKENAGNLLAFLIANRTNDITIIEDENNYIFGHEYGNGSYSAQLIDEVISVNHTGVNRWRFSLNFHLKELL